MKAYSTDLREKLVLAYESGEGTLDEVADTFGVGRCTVARMMKLWRAGQSLAPLAHGGGYPATLDKKLLALLTSQVAVQPDATLSELAAHLKKKAKVEVHLSTVCRALRKLGLPRKKKPCGFGAGRSRPASLSSKSRPPGSSPFCLYRRNGLSFGLDQSLWPCGTRPKSQPKRATQSRQGSDLDREFGFARIARATLD
jgi:transposase